MPESNLCAFCSRRGISFLLAMQSPASQAGPNDEKIELKGLSFWLFRVIFETFFLLHGLHCRILEYKESQRVFTCRHSQGQVYNLLFSHEGGGGERHLKLIMIIWVSFGFPLGIFGILWVPLEMGSLGFFVVPWGSLGFLWVPMGSLKFFGDPWGYLGFLWVPLGPYGFS